MNFLETILKQKKAFVKQRKKAAPKEQIIKNLTALSQPRFKEILKSPDLHLIAEIKRASPSKGIIREDLDVVRIAKIYQKEGVELVSVVTEEKFFSGSIEDLIKVKENSSLSILCKDFIIDDYQIYEAKLYGADAVLLIARILTAEELENFLDVAKSLLLDAIVEVHSEEDLVKIKRIYKDIDIFGINHRDLDDFSIDLEITKRLLPKIPESKLIIVESGIESASQIRHFKDLGVKGVLIGESLMRENDIAIKLREFVSATK